MVRIRVFSFLSAKKVVIIYHFIQKKSLTTTGIIDSPNTYAASFIFIIMAVRLTNKKEIYHAKRFKQDAAAA